MDVLQLRYFAEVARSGSISRAAIRLRVAQSAISRHVTRLEREIGAPLFLRSGRGVRLTEAGDYLLGRAERIIADLEETKRGLAARRVAPGGLVAIGMTHTVAASLAPPMVHAFRKRFPDVRVHILEGLGGRLQEQLAAGAIQAALLYDPPASKQFRSEELNRESVYLIGRKGTLPARQKEIEFAALARLPLVLTRAEHPMRRILETTARKMGLVLDVQVEVESASSIRSLIARGTLFTAFQLAAAHADVLQGRFAAARIVRPVITRRLKLTTSAGEPLGDAARHLLAVARQEMARLIREGRWPTDRASQEPV
ncbi:MAG: LysR family transcriptional regulator [Alphaproteobacteria bacterium]